MNEDAPRLHRTLDGGPRTSPSPVAEDATSAFVPTGRLRFMYEYFSFVPLWDARGEYDRGEDHGRTWLRDVFGISEVLVDDLFEYCVDMELRDRVEGDEEEEEDFALERRARALFERIRVEVGDRYTITYVPWVMLPGEDVNEYLAASQPDGPGWVPGER